MKLTIITIAAILALSMRLSAGSTTADSSLTTDNKAVTSTATDTSSLQSKVQTECPVMSGTIDRSVFVIWKGDKNHGPKKVYFCCGGCIDPFNKDPIKYIKKLEKKNQPIEDVAVKQELKKK